MIGPLRPTCGTFDDVPAVIAFDDLELDAALFELRRGGTRVPMEPQTFDVLAYLVAHRDRVVPKEELMDAVWGGRFVSEAAVTSRIKQARRAVGDDGQAQRVIQTVHGRGYRFVAEVGDGAGGRRVTDGCDRARWGRSATRPATACDIAFQVSGRTDGVGPDIVLISGFVSHLELDWADSRHAHFLHRLGSMGRLIRFDKRGTGMSDRPPGVPDLETRMHDVLVGDGRGRLAAGGARRLLRGRADGAADGGHPPGAGVVAGPLLDLRQAAVVGGLPVGADTRAAGGATPTSW